ncbi:hybrid sensor histidine kinase/response regulator [Muricoccus radiodurans]|uniref:hybrid sensor histidine kinase/response regulator n=1 Tax=Muricoccus radiodurans TaxID=2231721 RepID=UPI003CF51C22
MSDFRQELLAAFAAEHREHLSAIRAILSAAEDAPADAATLREVFRRAHSLKGAARAVDLPDVEAVAHRLEAILGPVMEGAAPLDHAAITRLHRGLDAIEASAAAAAAGAAPPAVEAVLAALDAPAGVSVTGPPPAPPPASPSSPPPSPPERPAGPADDAFVRVETAQLERLSSAAHELLALMQRGDETASWREVEAGLRGLRRDWEALRATLAPDAAHEARPRGFEASLAALTRRVGALARGGRDAADTLDRAGRALREEVEAVSLVPAETVFGALGRAVREMAREAGRDVVVRLEGMEVQAERRTLQALKDPVLHLLRNALGHGARTDGERGEIGLRVAASGGRLRVTVWDDGPGPDLAKLEAAAVSRGLLPARAPGAPPPSPARVLRMAFEAGLSTAEGVDRLQGRGMGMSVVAEAARAMRGGAAMRRRAPRGTEVVLELPFATARQALLLLEAGGQVFALPSSGAAGRGVGVTVGPLLDIPPRTLARAEGRPVARLTLDGAEAVVPIVPLTSLLGLEEVAPGGASTPAVLLTRGTTRMALAATALRDVRNLVVGEVDAPGVDAALVSGATLLEEEAIALVLRPDGLMSRWQAGDWRPLPAVPQAEPEAAPAAKRTVLVVDDSITTRTLEKSILEAGGYRVVLAVDGQDALNLLRAGLGAVDLVLADVEMPRLDGFGLLAAMKADPRLAALPVVLMTSRDRPEDVRRGMELGAASYLTKQGFDQDALLATIGQMI